MSEEGTGEQHVWHIFYNEFQLVTLLTFEGGLPVMEVQTHSHGEMRVAGPAMGPHCIVFI